MSDVSFHPILEYFRKLISEIDPQTCEVVRLGDRAATYGVRPKKMKEGYVYLMPHKQWINLGFYHGALFQFDILEGTGKHMRHIKIKTLADAQKPEIKELITLAMQERRGIN